MTDQPKFAPREWRLENNYEHRYVSGPNTLGEHGQLIRITVVEKSAYDALKADRDRLAGEVEELVDALKFCNARAHIIAGRKLGCDDLRMKDLRDYGDLIIRKAEEVLAKHSKPFGRPSCPNWLGEGRAICCEMVSEDGVNWFCAHCGYKPEGSEK